MIITAGITGALCSQMLDVMNRFSIWLQFLYAFLFLGLTLALTYMTLRVIYRPRSRKRR